MLAVTDPDGSSTGRQAVLYATALLPVTMAAGLLASAGRGYLWGSLFLGLAFLLCAALFARSRTIPAARRLFLASVLYLPALLGLMVFDR
jgi:protoheme IX farnesyltransferase